MKGVNGHNLTRGLRRFAFNVGDTTIQIVEQ
jgi:hypothetical protein